MPSSYFDIKTCTSGLFETLKVKEKKKMKEVKKIENSLKRKKERKKDMRGGRLFILSSLFFEIITT